MPDSNPTTVVHREPQGNTNFEDDALEGLSQEPKRLPCKYFYDRRGSELFDAICEQPEYYLTRTELAIMRQYAHEMAEALDERVMLVEFGSGSSIKTEMLLDQLKRPAAYVPVDISGDHLQSTANRLQREYPDLEVLPVCADFTKEFSLPDADFDVSHHAVYFPGSTIGNLQPEAATRLLQQIARISGSGGGLLIGIDLQKDIDIIEAAYNDAAGVTAEFNLNLLRRMNRELDADFQLDQFAHSAQYDTRYNRVDIRLVSQAEQEVHLNGETIEFADGEPILTEYSHKYTVEGFAALAALTGFQLRRVWTDPKSYFAILHLIIPE